MGNQKKVCVTGGSSYFGSSIVKKLLEKGYTVHATLRNLEDEAKVGLLKSLPNAETNLVLFQADVYNNCEFQPAIDGCEVVFHLATPLQHDPNSTQFKDRVESTVAATKSVVDSCINSGSVKRLIYPGIILAVSPLNEDGTSYDKPCADESCWTPLDISYSYANEFTMDHLRAKTLAEKEVLNAQDDDKLDVVTLAVGLVGGETSLPSVPLSLDLMISQVKGNEFGYNGMMFIQQLLGSVPIVHIDDVSEAHIFCMENPSVKGRFICAGATPTTKDLSTYLTQNYPEFKIDDKLIGEDGEKIHLDTSKLTNLGFVYKYDMKKILDESLECARRLGAL
ncbi:NADPH HC-toxin reductase 1-like [Euphorbia lathyris]|uniref:NADPH HC-toxin reductase 1-like n=1 Tax=Euphorbia lathyris TaxID=212925 RepID=UPI003313CB29